MEKCELAKMIGNKELEKFFQNNPRAGTELDLSFLGFETIYKSVTTIVPKNFTIIDLGCAYALQSVYFVEYKRYIGVDVDDTIEPIKTNNSCYYLGTKIQDFIKNLKNLNLNLEECFAICSYVPDIKAQEMVRNTFKNCLVYYPV